MSNKRKIFSILITILCSFTLFGEDNLAACTINSLRIREAPTLNSAVIDSLTFNEKCTLLDRTSYMVEIDDIRSFWFFIRTENDIEGYVFGGYLHILDPYFLGTSAERMTGFNRIYKPFNFKKVYLENTEITFYNTSKKRRVDGIYYVLDENDNSYLVFNEDLEIGWIDPNDIVRDDYYDKVTKFDNLEEIDSIKLQNLFLEKILIDQEKISRNGKSVRYSNGLSNFELIDNEDQNIRYNIIDIHLDRYIFYSILYFEGLEYKVYDLITEETYFFGYSYPHYSSDGNFAFTFGSFYLDSPTLRIFNFYENECKLEYNEKLINIDPYDFNNRIQRMEWDSYNEFTIEYDLFLLKIKKELIWNLEYIYDF